MVGAMRARKARKPQPSPADALPVLTVRGEWGSVELGPVGLPRGRAAVGALRECLWPYERPCAECGEPAFEKLMGRAAEGGETWCVSHACGCRRARRQTTCE